MIISILSAALYSQINDSEDPPRRTKPAAQQVFIGVLDNEKLDPFSVEPFDFYGGNFLVSEVDKKNIVDDTVYRRQELTISKLQQSNAALISEIATVQATSAQAEQNFTEQLHKCQQLTSDLQQLRDSHKTDLAMLHQTSEQEKTVILKEL